MKPLMRLLMVAVCCAAGASLVEASSPKLKVVATLSTFADLVRTIGGEQAEVSSIVPARFDPHFIEPKPSDVVKVKRADLLVHGGLDLEAWRGPLLDAAGNTRVMPGQLGELDLSQGIALLEVPAQTPSRAQGDIHLYGNPHYWLDPRNGLIMAETICDKLCAMDAAHCEVFRRNRDAFQQQTRRRIDAWRTRLSAVRGREAVAYHNAWPYLAAFAGIRTEQFLEPKPGIPPTPRQLALLERYMREHGIQAIVESTSVPVKPGQTLAKRTGAKVVRLCQNVGELPACADYAAMIEYNVEQLVAGLQ